MGMMATMPIWPTYLSSAELAHHSPTVARVMNMTYACFHVMGSCTCHNHYIVALMDESDQTASTLHSAEVTAISQAACKAKTQWMKISCAGDSSAAPLHYHQTGQGLTGTRREVFQ